MRETKNRYIFVKQKQTDMKRELTGEWYIKKKRFGFTIMVELIKTTTCDFDFSQSPEFTCWEEAKPYDLIKLNIKIM